MDSTHFEQGGARSHGREAGEITGIVRTADRRRATGGERHRPDAIELRPSQQGAFEALRATSFAILNAPTGWGKSLVLCALAGDELLASPNRKVVICIPQNVIAKGFIRTAQVKLPGGAILNWDVTHNLCSDKMAGEKVDFLADFLVSPAAGDSINKRVVICTHVGLTAAFAKLGEEPFRHAICNTTFFVDEAHHLQASDESCNQLGGVISHVLDSGEPTVRVLLATAFFFRGDKLSILNDDHLGRFERHTVPFDTYWRTLEHLETYEYNFVTYKGTVWTPLEKLLEYSQVPTIVYCPPLGHRLLLGKHKDCFAERVLRLIKKHYGARLWRPGLQAAVQNNVVLDLVDTSFRAEKVQFAMNHGDRIAAILTVGMFREGADWVQAARVIDLIPSGSDQDRNQRFGRLIRDCPGKTSVAYYSFFPQITDLNDDEQRRDLTKLYAHFHASLVLDNALAPIQIPKLPSDGEGSEKEARGRPVDLLGQYDEQTQEAIVTECHESLIRLHAKCEQEHTVVTAQQAQNAVYSVLKGYSVEDPEPLAKQIVLLFRRRSNLSLPVADLVNAGFDKVWHSDALEGIRLFSGGVGGPSTFAEIREAIAAVCEARWMEMYEQLRSHPGAPPRQSRASWWITNQKSAYRDGGLSDERVRLLEQIPWWKWTRTPLDRWMDMYKQAAALSDPPAYCGRGKASPVYQWCGKQRMAYRQGKLSEQQIELLGQITWWVWDSELMRWEENYSALVKLNRLPRAAEEYGEERLYNWVQSCRKRRHGLSPEQLSRLEALPFWTWNGVNHARWEEQFRSLADLGRKPRSSPTHGEQGHYDFMRSCIRRRDRLTEEQIERLESFDWWTW